LAVYLAVRPEAAVAARAALVRCLAGHISDAALADAELLVSELVTNSVRHAAIGADAFVRVAAEVADGVLRIEVDDPGTVGAVAIRTPDLGGGGGFGLRIVEALSRRWGVARNGSTRVWAELACAPEER
jgi:anti-sigma regulatory factor (Ser/Thr protein kinase)